MIPVATEFPVVAPVNAQVKFVTEQLSAVTGFTVATLAVQVPVPTFGVKFVGQEVKVGFSISGSVHWL